VAAAQQKKATDFTDFADILQPFRLEFAQSVKSVACISWPAFGLPPLIRYATACFSARLVVAYSSSGVNGFAM
jgi:hypothetical protein